ncbi:hypothetical protein NFI96_021125 [Prochilodus magdalenae]|nr:hypothetical protein NFI96_021125 [Prochilodus magdalenae]
MIFCVLLLFLQVIGTVSDLSPYQDHKDLDTEEDTQSLAVLEFPESSAGLRRRKREWIIPPISFRENDRGPFPKRMVQIKSSYGKETRITYSITGEGVDQPPVGLFTINKLDGTLFVTKPLDRETKDKYTLQAHAVSPEVKEEPMEIVVNVIDMNDNKPVFTQDPFIGSVPEASPIGFELMTVTATDADDPETDNADVRYTINSQTPQTPNPNMFVINPVTGAIRVNSEGLDREKHPEYTLEIQASDMQGNGLVSIGRAVITVTDSNDHAPIFDKASYSVSVPENEVGAVVVKMPVTDGDEPQSPAWTTRFRIVSGNRDGFFSVSTGPNKQEGIITTVKPLDLKENNKYTLLVVAENDVPFAKPLTTSTATVIVNVVVGNKAPVFHPEELIISVPENLAVDDKLTVYTATDPDTAKTQKVTYRVGADPAGWLSVDTETGLVKVRSPMDRESPFVKEGRYTALILAMDDGQVPATGTGTLVIEVKDVNDNAPTINEKMIRVCNKQSAPVLLSVTDRDGSGFAAPYQVELQGESRNIWSAMMNAKKTGIILQLQTTLKEGVYVIVLRVYDNMDRYQDSVVLASVCDCTEAEVCEFIVPSMMASLSGSDVAMQTQVMILPPCFTDEYLESCTSCQTLTNGTESSSWPKYKGPESEEAAVAAAELHQTIQTVHEFPESSLVLRRRKREWVIPPISFPENDRGPFPKRMVQIKSSYVSETKITYSITGEGADQPPVGLFTINNLNGTLFVTKPLDRETKDKYTLQAHAVSPEVKEDPMEIIVNVIDMNDNKPVFIQDPFIGSVPEVSPIGFEFMTVTATDADDPETDNADVRYTIVSQRPQTPNPNMFIINPVTGAIRVNSEGLDREKDSEYTLEIQAADMQGNGLVSMGKAVITVTDSNDHAPTFEKTSYSVTVPENKVGFVVVKMPVTDGDDPQSPAWTARFRIVSGNRDGFFNVSTGPNKQEGIVTTVKPLDYEENNKYTLLVVAENNVPFAKPLTTSTATVIVNVADVNEAPVFYPEEEMISVPENLAVDDKLTVYTATDPDTAKNQKVIYRVGNDPAGWLKVEEETGQIKVKSPMDRESLLVKDDKYTALILAIDDDQIPATGTGTLVIKLNDVNDNAPVIQERSIRMCNKESVPVLLSVTDKDGPNFGAPYKVELQEDSRRNWSAVMNETKTGIKLQLQTTLEYGVYSVVMRVYDYGDKFQDSTVSATVLGTVSDLSPFQDHKDLDTQSLAEWPFSPCRYRTRFTVDNDTLLPASAIMFTRSFAFALGLICTLRTKARSSLGHRTFFLPEPYDGWTLPSFLYLCIIVCTDERGTFRHLEVAPKDEPDLCKSTILFLISWLISFDFPMMLLKEAACFRCALKYIHRNSDGVKQGHHSVVDVYVVLGVSELISVSCVRNQVLEFPESSAGLRRRKREWVIPPISFPENDRGPFPKRMVQIKSSYGKETKITYSINGEGADQPPVGLFTINKLDGTLFVTKPLDRETKDKYTLQAHAVSPEVKEDPMEIIVNVIDMNDNKPVFTQDPFIGSVPEASPIGFEFMTVTATDADDPETDNADVRYTITSQTPQTPNPNMFIINPVTGAIRVNSEGLDREKDSEYTLEIQAADMQGNGLVSMGKAFINVTDSNDHAPQFDKNQYSVTVPENKVGFVVVKMPVTDGDDPQSPAWTARFRIVSGNNGGFFNVSTGPNKQEGIVTTVKPLDYEENNKYTPLVVAENNVPFAKPLTTSTATVIVNVADVNEAPVFYPEELIISVPENLAVDDKLTVYTATDPDTAKNQKVIYRVGNDSAGWLKVEEETGQIKVRSSMDRESLLVKDDKYTALILAIDDDQIPATGTGTLVIKLTDVNDNAPVIEERSIRMCNKESAPVLLSVTDKDGPNFGAPYKAELQGDSRRNWSAVMNETKTGIKLQLQTTLEYGVYSVVMRVYDYGDKFQDSTVSATVCDCTGQDVQCNEKAVAGFGHIWDAWNTWGYFGFYFMFLFAIYTYRVGADPAGCIYTTAGQVPATGTGTLVIEVKDVNDNAPTINEQMIRVCHKQSAPVLLSVTDRDGPGFAAPYHIELQGESRNIWSAMMNERKTGIILQLQTTLNQGDYTFWYHFEGIGQCEYPPGQHRPCYCM